ncbi:autotransporter domain-containing protein [Enterobacteriaceae bacterium RIT691]|nr:autotransporter domain-containing protein [Enterobacteriaceae bacterium RIT691]
MIQRSTLSLCVAFALQGNLAWAAPAEPTEEQTEIQCPSDLSKVTKQQKEKLTPECLKLLNTSDDDNTWAWVAGGATALLATLGIVATNGGDHSHHSSSNASGGGNSGGGSDTGGGGNSGGGSDTGGGGNSGGGSDTGGGDNSGGGSDTGGGDNSGGGSDTGGGGDSGGGSDTGGGDDSGGGTDTTVTTYDNNVTIDKGAKTLTVGNSVWNIATNSDGTWTLTNQSDGRNALLNQYKVDADSNTIKLDMISGDGTKAGVYDYKGNLTLTDIDDMTLTDGSAVTISGGTASGSGNAGKIVDGSGNTVSIGDSTATESGTGSFILGDDNIITNNGTTSASGTGSIGVEVDGNNNTVNNTGDVTASDGAAGILVSGDGNTITNGGTTTVSSSDENTRATGVAVDGNGNTVTQTGVLNVGDFSTGLDVSGTGNTVNLDSPSINVTGQKAIGVNVSGENNSVTLSGDMVVDKDQTEDIAADYFYDPSVGINVDGNNNTVTLDGSLTVVIDTEYAGPIYGNFNGSEEQNQGLSIKGDGNTVTLNQGIHLVGEVDAITDINAGNAIANQRSGYADFSPVIVDGKSTLVLQGESTVSGEFPGAMPAVFTMNNGASLLIEDGASFVVDGVVDQTMYGTGLIDAHTGSSITNMGSVESTDMTIARAYDTGSVASNQGSMTLNRTSVGASTSAFSISGLMANRGATAVNESGATITGKVSNLDAVVNVNKDYSTTTPQAFNGNAVSIQGMAAVGKGSTSPLDTLAVNNGTIDLAGRGVAGMVATYGNATVVNTGAITTDALWEDPNDTTALRSNIGDRAIDYSVGMAAGGGAGQANSSALNQGTITVNNAGAGMAASGAGNVAVNQGTINLEKNENYDATAPQVGMAVYSGATAINDTTGVININTDSGVAFYNDGTGAIVNYGLVCTYGNCEDASQYNPTDSNVSLSWLDGNVITAAGETLTLADDGYVAPGASVSNAGTVTGKSIYVENGSHLTNDSSGSIANVNIVSGGEYLNQGITSTVDADGDFINEGTVTGLATIASGSTANNSGNISQVEQWASTFYNSGDVSSWKGSSDSAVMNNEADGSVNKVTFAAASTFNNAGDVHHASVDKNGVFNNLAGGTVVLDDKSLWSGQFNNWGTVNSDADIATAGSGSTVYNGTTGVINGQVTTTNNSGASKAINDGTINIDKDNNVAMSAHGSSMMVNNGTINVGSEGTTQTGMVGMQLEADASASGVVENNGTINIYASNSYAFSKLGSNGHVVNNGTVYIDDSVTGSGLIKQTGTTMEGSGEGGDGTAVNYVDFTAPQEPTMSTPGGSSSGSSTSNDLNGYVVGTSADGSAGKLMVNNASMNGVEVNTGFAAGTAATTVTFDNVVEGKNLTDAAAITSTSVVWTAQGTTDASGNVDVAMTKNAYTSVVNDSSVNSVAAALDAGYTNNELYNSLNMATSSDVTKAMKQISGSQALNVTRDARVLSNRFDMLADAASMVSNGLSFNVVAKGDPRAELSNDTQYDMMALRQKLGFGNNQSLTLEYGIARLDGDGNVSAGQDGITGGYSQFFGLDHAMPIGENGLSWNNGLRYDVHQLDSKRGINYGDVNKQASADTKQQYLELRSEGRKTFNVSEGLDITSYAGVKLRHTLDDGYKETGAGDFNLNMNSTTETAVDSVVGMKLSYAGKNGWAATATVEGGPNLSYSTSGKTASLQGASGQNFAVDDGQKGGGINGMAQVGVKYHAGNTAASLEAFHWKEDGISDKGLMVNYKYNF